MAESFLHWGCCAKGKVKEKNSVTCKTCNKHYHCACLGLDEDYANSRKAASWICPSCSNNPPKAKKNDNNPIRQYLLPTTVKKKASSVTSLDLNSECPLTREDVSFIVQDTMQSQFDEMLTKMNDAMINALNSKLNPFRDEIRDLVNSMEYINSRFEDISKEHKVTQETVTVLKKENENLKATVSDLNNRIDYLEQYSRSKNIEIQCVPETTNENLINMVMQLGRTIGSHINETHILNCTRVAKIRRDVNRPRSIVVEMSTSRLRDEFLTCALKYNKHNSGQKLNSSLLGITGNSVPIYISEHLSPSNKALHAAVRIKAKEHKYKFVWIRNGRIFARKNEESQFLWIKDTRGLDKII